MTIFKGGVWYYVRIEKEGEAWTPSKVKMEPSRWRTKTEAKAGEVELR